MLVTSSSSQPKSGSFFQIQSRSYFFPTNAYFTYFNTFITLSTYYHYNTARSLEKFFTPTWVSPSPQPTWVSPCATSPSPGGTPPSPTTSSSPSSSTPEEASPSSSLQAFSIHLHLLLHHHQDGAVLQKGWRNSVGFTVLIIILSSPGARTGFSIL